MRSSALRLCILYRPRLRLSWEEGSEELGSSRVEENICQNRKDTACLRPRLWLPAGQGPAG